MVCVNYMGGARQVSGFTVVSSGSGQVFDEVDLSDEWCDYDDEGTN